MTIQEIFKRYNPKPVRNQFRMKCVFRENHDASNDGSNSFFITPDINAYHCFSCKEHGSLISLLTVRFEIPFMDAIEMVSFDNFDRIFNEKKREETIVDEIIPLTAPAAFLKRGFNERLLRQFKVGSEGEHIYIPIYDNKGEKMVAIKHRINRDFWYTPEKFPKERYLYNYNRAVKSQVLEDVKRVVLVEGETDVYQSCKNSVWNVVAQSGGDLTDDQADLLEKFDEIYLALDNDKAGTNYAEIAYRKLSIKNVEVKVMLYNAEDPGSCKREEWLRAYLEAVSFAEYRFHLSMEMGEDYTKYIKR